MTTTTSSPSDSTRRALRSGIDALLTILTALLAVVVFPGLPELLDEWTAPGTTAAVGIVAGALLVFFAKVRNALEDAGKVPAILKAPASNGANPVPEAHTITTLDQGEAEHRLE